MNNFKIDMMTLRTDKFELKFDLEIDKVLQVDDMYLVLLKIPKGSKEVDNLYGVSYDGVYKWRVQSIQEAFNIPQNSPYIAMDIIDEVKVRITNFYGMRFRVNPYNGFLSEQECIGW